MQKPDSKEAKLIVKFLNSKKPMYIEESHADSLNVRYIYCRSIAHSYITIKLLSLFFSKSFSTGP